MLVSPDYVYQLTDRQIRNNFPNLTNDKFQFTSEWDPNYNCVAYINDIKDEYVQFYDEATRTYDTSLKRYISYFEEFGFRVTENSDLQEGITKIAISYDENKEFRHVCKQLPAGEWTSKLGDWEDITHINPNVLLGNLYANELIFMEK